LFAACPLRVDAVEKVGGMPLARNNQIMGANFLNQSCAFDARLESILLGDPFKILFQQHRSLADIATGQRDIRFTPESGH
jgi:hypothetical protein